MAHKLKSALIGLSMFALSACITGPQLAPAGLYDAGSYQVRLATDWNAIAVKTGNNKNGHLLTLDGPALNSVYLFSDIKEGDSLIKERNKENPVPTFDPALFELELVEFVTDSLQKGSGLGSIQTRDIRPDTFAGNDAVRFDFTGVDQSGLNISGEALLAVADDTLDALLFMAPTEYYFEKDRANIDAIFNSVASGTAIG